MARRRHVPVGTSHALGARAAARLTSEGTGFATWGGQRLLDLRVLEHVRIQAWDRLLFIESGDGWLVEEAWRHLGKGYVCGLCASPELVDLAVRLRGVRGRVEFKVWDAERFPLADQSFDRVISCVPCRCYPEPEVVLREMARVLRPDGDVYLPESDGATPEAPEVERLLVRAGFGEVQRDRTTPRLIHARQGSPGTRARRDD